MSGTRSEPISAAHARSLGRKHPAPTPRERRHGLSCGSAAKPHTRGTNRATAATGQHRFPPSSESTAGSPRRGRAPKSPPGPSRLHLAHVCTGARTPLLAEHGGGRGVGAEWPSPGGPGPRRCLGGGVGGGGSSARLSPPQPPRGAGVTGAHRAPSCRPSATLPAQTPRPFHSVGVLICWQQWAG